MAYDEELAQRVREHLSNHEGITEKKMFGGLCFLFNGNMCCGMTGDDLMLRVHPDDYEKTLTLAGARPMDFTGRPMRGMVYVAPAALSTSRSLRRWLNRALDFVATLPPKPGKDEAGHRSR